MRKFYLILLLLIPVSAIAQDKLVVFKKNGVKTETLTTFIDSITYPDEKTMRIHNLNSSITDIPIVIIDSLKMIPDQTNSFTDRAALIAFYNATGGPNWTNNINWCSDKPLNEWYGIITENERVVEINITWNNITGKIPKEIGNFKKLKHLSLGYNFIEGPLPVEIGNLCELLDLTIINMVTLNGPIPSTIGNLSKITEINLSMNQLSGEIPAEIGNLTNLKKLVLGSNKLNGSIPESLGDLPKLEFVNIARNELSGIIPASITNWFIGKDQLIWKKYHMYENNFSGVLPSYIVQHPLFIYNWHSFVLQNMGYGFDFEGIKLQIPDFVVTDIHGGTIEYSKEYQKNRLTGILDWSTTCSWSEKLVSELIDLHNNYKGIGFDIIGTTTEELAPNRSLNDIFNYIDNKKVPWRNFINYGNMYEGYTNRFPILTNYSPNFYLVDSEGVVVWNRAFEKDKDSYKKFLTSYFGPSNYYESTDYSQDGVVMALNKSTVNNGNNLIIVGDGFTDKDMAPGGLYEQRMTEAMNHFFSVEPMKTYKHYFNVYSVKAVSKNGIFASDSETVFGSNFTCGPFIDGNLNKAIEYANKVSGINTTKTPIVVVVNSPIYGGTCHYLEDGSTIAFAPKVAFSDDQFGAIIHHEVNGHAFGRLLDEYIYNNVKITKEYMDEFNSRRQKYNAGWNLTLDKQDIPWQYFIGNSKYSMVGTYEGGYFYRYGVWRAEQNSCMNDNVAYFNGPSRELMVKRIKKQAGEMFSWEDFMAKDKIEIPMFKKAVIPTIPLFPPVFHDKDGNIISKMSVIPYTLKSTLN